MSQVSSPRGAANGLPGRGSLSSRSCEISSGLSRAVRELILWTGRLRLVPLLGYALSCLIIGLALGIRLLLGDALQGVPYITIFPAVIIATFLGGLGPGLLAMALGGIGAWFLLLPQPYPWIFSLDERMAQLLAYVLVASFDCLLIDWLIKTAEHDATLARRNELLMRELQHRVKITSSSFPRC